MANEIERKYLTIEKLDLADRDRWVRGIWDHEPDKAVWRHQDKICMIVRNNFGALCGYAGVLKDHALFDAHYDDDALKEVSWSIHGMLTYSGRCGGNVCHVADREEEEEVYWFGFDCAHTCDFIPLYSLKDSTHDYKDFEYVAREVEKLSEQLAVLDTANQV